MLGSQRENELGIVREIDRGPISNNVCTLLETFCPTRSLNMKFGTRGSGEKFYGLQNDFEVAV